MLLYILKYLFKLRKKKITTNQENLSEDEFIDGRSRECWNVNTEKGRIVYQEANQDIKIENR